MKEFKPPNTAYTRLGSALMWFQFWAKPGQDMKGTSSARKAPVTLQLVPTQGLPGHSKQPSWQSSQNRGVLYRKKETPLLPTHSTAIQGANVLRVSSHGQPSPSTDLFYPPWRNKNKSHLLLPYVDLKLPACWVGSGRTQVRNVWRCVLVTAMGAHFPEQQLPLPSHWKLLQVLLSYLCWEKTDGKARGFF